MILKKYSSEFSLNKNLVKIHYKQGSATKKCPLVSIVHNKDGSLSALNF